MAIPFIVLNGDEDKATRLRRSITGGSCSKGEVRKITMDDIELRWPLLEDSGFLEIEILSFANNNSVISNEAFTSMMKALNSYL